MDHYLLLCCFPDGLQQETWKFQRFNNVEKGFGNLATRSELWNNPFEKVMSQEIRAMSVLSPFLLTMTHDPWPCCRKQRGVSWWWGLSWTQVLAQMPSHWPFCSCLLPAHSQLPSICPGCSRALKACFWILCPGVLTLRFTLPLPLSFSDRIPFHLPPGDSQDPG